MLQDRESAVGYAHEHISPIWSASVAMAGHVAPAIATPYYSNDNITNYVRLHPRADRFELVRQAATALVHIHSKNVVHGDICPVSFYLGCLSGFWISSGPLLIIGLAGKYVHY
jgi:serine/threonine protein kinase